MAFEHRHDYHVAVLAGHIHIRHQRKAGRLAFLRLMVGGVGQFVGHDRRHSLLQRQVDFAALAAELPGKQGGHTGRRAQYPGHQFGQRSIGCERRFLRRILHSVRDSGGAEGQPAGGHRRQVVAHVPAVWPRQAEGRDGGDYQAGIEMLQSLAAQTLFHYLGALSADYQDVGLGHQLVEDRFLARLPQVQAHAALVGVQVQEHPAPVGVGSLSRACRRVGERAVPPVAVAPGRLHLYHVGSGVPQQPGAEGCRRHPGVFDYPHVGEGRGRSFKRVSL